MDEPPIHLLTDLASVEEQRRFVINATVDEYLLPEEIVGNAWHFCELAELPTTYARLTKHQQDVVARLKSSLDRLSDCIHLYDRSNIAELIERDVCWAALRSQAGEAITAFKNVER